MVRATSLTKFVKFLHRQFWNCERVINFFAIPSSSDHVQYGSCSGPFLACRTIFESKLSFSAWAQDSSCLGLCRSKALICTIIRLVSDCSTFTVPSKKNFFSERDLSSWPSIWFSECWGSRHTFTVMSFLGLANLYAMRVNLSVAIVAMSQSGQDPIYVSIYYCCSHLAEQFIFCFKTGFFTVTN